MEARDRDPLVRITESPIYMATATTGGRMWTVVAMLDDSRIRIEHPDGVADDAAEVHLSAGIWPAGMERCCERTVVVTPAPLNVVFDDLESLVELNPGNPRAGSVFGSTTAGPHVLAFGVGGWTVGIVANPDRPFTSAELALYDDLVDLIDRGGDPPLVRARPPLILGGARASITLDGPTPVGVTIFDTLPDGDCRSDADTSSVYSECAVGFQVLGFTRSDPGADAPELDVSVSRVGASGRLGPPPWSIAGFDSDWPPGPVTVRGTRILTGGVGSGLVVGVSETRNAVSWSVDLGESAFVSPIVVDDTVLAAGAFGDLVALDAFTGARRWELPVDPRRPVLPLVAIDGLAPSPETLLVVPTNRPDVATAPVVYGVDPVDGRVLWETALSPEVSLGSWEPVAAGGHVVVSGIAVYDNRDALLVVYGLTTEGELVWTYAAEPSMPTGGQAPVVADGAFVEVRDGTDVVRLDAATGEPA